MIHTTTTQHFHNPTRLDFKPNSHPAVTQVTDMLQKEDWAGLQRHFSPLLRLILPKSLLKKGFDLVQLTIGPLIRTKNPVMSVGWLTYHLFNSGEGLSTALEYDTLGNVDEVVIEDVEHWVKGIAGARRKLFCCTIWSMAVERI